MMKRSTLVGSVATCFLLGLTAPLLADDPTTTAIGPPLSLFRQNVSATKVANSCLSDLSAFDGQIEKDGYWLGGPGDGHDNPRGKASPAAEDAYASARLGYEVRTLLASANILARNGQDQACEDVLATTRNIYKRYVADLRSGKVPTVDGANWRQEQVVAAQQIAVAQPVTTENTPLRFDQLLGTEVRNLQNVALGSVDDLVTIPQTGKIAYLLIARGGFFGFGEKYVPVPWENFKSTPDTNRLVLDATKVAMDAAPQIGKDQFATSGNFAEESQKLDAYWKAVIASK